MTLNVISRAPKRRWPHNEQSDLKLERLDFPPPAPNMKSINVLHKRENIFLSKATMERNHKDYKIVITVTLNIVLKYFMFALLLNHSLKRVS